jgi:hypothetical protein
VEQACAQTDQCQTNNFLPFFVQTTQTEVGNRTDVFIGFSTP